MTDKFTEAFCRQSLNGKFRSIMGWDDDGNFQHGPEADTPQEAARLATREQLGEDPFIINDQVVLTIIEQIKAIERSKDIDEVHKIAEKIRQKMALKIMSYNALKKKDLI